MTTPLLYIHGLGSDRTSSKFQAICTHFDKEYTMHCLEWTTESNIKELLNDAFNTYENDTKLILFGDSTGANFAYQLREQRAEKGLETTLILTSPLLDLSKRIAAFDFPKILEPYIIKINAPNHALLICPLNDEIIDHSWLNNLGNTSLVIKQVHDSHRLPEFKNYLPLIRNYLNK